MATKQQKHNLPSLASYPKLLTFQMHIHRLVFHFLIFGSGLALGITLSFYLKDFPFTLYQFKDPQTNITNSSSNLYNNLSTSQSKPTPIISLPASPPPPLEILSPPLPSTLADDVWDTSTSTSTSTRVGLSEFLKPSTVRHDMADEELLWRASMVPKAGRVPLQFTPKIAFLFLARRDVTMAPLWDRFFKGNEGLFSVYVHSNPSFNATVPQDSAFYGRWIPSKDVRWGDSNMVEAERRLLANALLDFTNQRFVLLSEACIPLFNFSTVYKYLMGSTKSFVEAYDLIGAVGRGRYNPRMRPQIKLDQWRKGSQWFEMDRALAIEVVADQKYFPIFRRFCRGSCYTDEHYLPTFVSIKFWRKNSNRTLTWVDWSKGGPHPAKFTRQDVTFELLEKLRHGHNCEYNGKRTNICHLFARKFLPNTLDRLLRFAPKLMQFNK